MVRRHDARAAAVGELGVDVVVEATGLFRTARGRGGTPRAGARKVVITAPGTDVDATIVMGINDDTYDAAHPRRDLQRLLHDQLRRTDGAGAGRLRSASSGAAHHRAQLHRRPEPPRRPAQGPAPRPVGRRQHHPDQHRRGEGRRPGAPRSWPARLDGVAVRVPVVDASLVDLTVLLDRDATAAEVNAAFEHRAEAQLKGILRCTRNRSCPTT